MFYSMSLRKKRKIEDSFSSRNTFLELRGRPTGRAPGAIELEAILFFPPEIPGASGGAGENGASSTRATAWHGLG